MDKKHLVQCARGLQVVPATATDLVAHTAWIYQIVVANTNSAAVTLLIQDKATSPKTLVPTVSLAINSLTIMSFPEGVKMTGGIRWVAGTADKLHAEIEAYYEPGA